MMNVKPCPFCGNKDVEVVEEFIHEGLHDGGWAWVVRCNYLKGGCGAKCGTRESDKEAIKTWNERKDSLSSNYDKIDPYGNKVYD